jgi:putative Mg2+ transporter-C (MgtC) family protein
MIMDYYDFIINVYSALGLGLLIGLEREFRQHPAGLRTNALVCVGSSLFMSLTFLLHDVGSPTRIASYIISGIGFLGGGVILKQGVNIRGMNTAATLWCSAAIGALCGSGHWGFGVGGTVTVLLVHLIFRPVSNWVLRLERFSEEELNFKINVVITFGRDTAIRELFVKFMESNPELTLRSLSTVKQEALRETEITAQMVCPMNKHKSILDLINILNDQPGTRVVSWEKETRLSD